MKQRMRIFGQIKKDGKIVGYSVLHITTNRAKMLTIEETKQIIKDVGCVNAIIKDGVITGTEASLDRLPIYDVVGNIVAQPRVTVLAQLTEGDSIVGYYLMDAYGRKGKFSIEDTIKYIQKFGSTNAKIMDRQGTNKPYISAIYGNFDKVETKGKVNNLLSNEQKAFETEEKDNKQNDQTDKGIFIRKYDNARYIGGDIKDIKYDTSHNLHKKTAAAYYDKLIKIRKSIDMLNRGKIPGYGYSIGCVTGETQKLLRDIIHNKYGKRIEKHYPSAMNFLNNDKDIRKKADELYHFRKNVVHKGNNKTTNIELWDSFISTPNADKKFISYLKLAESVIIDCLKYKRINLSIKFAKELSVNILNNDKANEYIKTNTGEEVTKKTIADTVIQASANKIDSLSAIMFISALEILALNYTSLQQYEVKYVINRIIQIIAEYNDATPKSIDGNKDYGALIFQALILAKV